MAGVKSNPLLESGKPLFFKAGNVKDVRVTLPEIRMEEAIRFYGRSLSLMQKEALVASARTGTVWRLASDEGAYLEGLDEAPCPLGFLTVGMVSSYMEEIRALARQLDITTNDIRLILDNYYTMTGSAFKGTMTGGAKDVDLTVQVASDSDRRTLEKLGVDATAASPLHGLISSPKGSLFTLTHNGKEIGLARASPIGGSAQTGFGDDYFDAARVPPGDWQSLIRRGGMTPKAEHTVTKAGGSLAEEQSRLLHVRGICTLREDGVKEVEQQLFNPHGSIFYFLCDEAPENGGKGIAPDAASYISAGLGFCFMTQLGRYAKIVKKDLQQYWIIQDAHFSLGGASGATGRPGNADPVETHVHLKTGEDDEFAQSILDMAEQTCFLHALCRSSLKTRVTVERY